jgi:hypothetical protein
VHDTERVAKNSGGESIFFSLTHFLRPVLRVRRLPLKASSQQAPSDTDELDHHGVRVI